MRARERAIYIDPSDVTDKPGSDASVEHEIRKGLTAGKKYIPSKYFYDARGSELFEAICHLPEYYPTGIELELLEAHAEDIVEGFQWGDLVELGSGADRKIRRLLDALYPQRRSNVRYVPFDVSETALTRSAEVLRSTYPELTVQVLVGDFTRDLHRIPSGRPKRVLFFGSTIGNLDEPESLAFLRSVADILGPDDRFVLGLDMLKDTAVLEAAYNDSRGVTAEFNKNMLLVLNREVGADFDPDDFEHRAFFNPDRERIEMHLELKRDARVRLPRLDLVVNLSRGETICTEICRKFSRSSTRTMLRESGLEVRRWFSDARGWFSIAEIVRSGSLREEAATKGPSI